MKWVLFDLLWSVFKYRIHFFFVVFEFVDSIINWKFDPFWLVFFLELRSGLELGFFRLLRR